jgi:hypothetical protein
MISSFGLIFNFDGFYFRVKMKKKSGIIMNFLWIFCVAKRVFFFQIHENEKSGISQPFHGFTRSMSCQTPLDFSGGTTRKVLINASARFVCY